MELAPLSGELFHQPQARALRSMAGDTVFVAAHATPALLHSQNLLIVQQAQG
jgi:hypothetical protein